MISRTTFATIVGVFDAIVHMFVMFFSFGMVHFIAFASDEEKKGSSEEEETTTMDPVKYKQVMEFVEAIYAGVFSILFFISIVMFIFAVLMVYGARKQRHTFMAPWVYTGVLAMIFHFLAIFMEDEEDDKYKFVYIFVCIFYAAIWYPIFKLYKKMRYCSKAPKVCPVHPHANYHPATYAAPAIQPYTAAPCNTMPCNTVPCNTVPSDFSHTAKYVHPEASKCTTSTTVQHQAMYPNMPAACKYPTSHV